jgi:hypothetical protein
MDSRNGEKVAIVGAGEEEADVQRRNGWRPTEKGGQSDRMSELPFIADWRPDVLRLEADSFVCWRLAPRSSQFYEEQVPRCARDDKQKCSDDNYGRSGRQSK